MTPTTLMDIALARCGIHNPSTPQYTRGRQYLNIIKTEAETATDWYFLHKVGTITTTDGTRSYSLASDVLLVIPDTFRDSTNNKMLKQVNPLEIDQYDPDADDESEVVMVAVTGINSTTGYWEVDLVPTPDTTTEYIKYRYKAFITDFTSAMDATDMGPKFPPWFQNALLWGTCALYKEQNDNTTAKIEWEKYTAALKFGMTLNNSLSPPPNTRMERPDERFTFSIRSTITPD